MKSITEPGGRCPSEELLAAYVDGTLGSEAQRAIETHLVACDRCLETVGATVRQLTAEEDSEAEEEPTRPMSLRGTKWSTPLRRAVVVAGSTLGAAAALILMVRGVTIARSDDLTIESMEQRLLKEHPSMVGTPQMPPPADLDVVLAMVPQVPQPTLPRLRRGQVTKRGQDRDRVETCEMTRIDSLQNARPQNVQVDSRQVYLDLIGRVSFHRGGTLTLSEPNVDRSQCVTDRAQAMAHVPSDTSRVRLEGLISTPPTVDPWHAESARQRLEQFRDVSKGLAGHPVPAPKP